MRLAWRVLFPFVTVTSYKLHVTTYDTTTTTHKSNHHAILIIILKWSVVGGGGRTSFSML